MNITDYLTQGGIPDGWTRQNLSWLAQAHRNLGKDTHTAAHGLQRSDWHRRWAALIEDVLETCRERYH